MLRSIDEFIHSLKYNSDGLIPTVVQHAVDKSVLMVAYMSPESIRSTIESGKATYYSRSRQKLWLKGETSGHYQHVKQIRLDCDRDTLLIEVEQEGVACHEGYMSCFFREVKVTPEGVISEGDCLDRPEKPE